MISDAIRKFYLRVLGLVRASPFDEVKHRLHVVLTVQSDASFQQLVNLCFSVRNGLKLEWECNTAKFSESVLMSSLSDIYQIMLVSL